MVGGAVVAGAVVVVVGNSCPGSVVGRQRVVVGVVEEEVNTEVLVVGWLASPSADEGGAGQRFSVVGVSVGGLVVVSVTTEVGVTVVGEVVVRVVVGSAGRLVLVAAWGTWEDRGPGFWAAEPLVFELAVPPP